MRVHTGDASSKESFDSSRRGPVGLEDILKTAELASRPVRPPRYQAESQALVALAREMAQSPQTLLAKLVERALVLCEAGSAGISLGECVDGRDVFRWAAVAGELAPLLGSTLPGDFSPCGVVIAHDAPQLMIEPGRFYPYILDLNTPVAELLLVPFHRGMTPIGTVWVVLHDATRRFDAEDLRLLTSLSQFAAVVEETLQSARSLQLSEAKFRQLADSVPSIVWQARPDGTLDYYNERWYEFTGFDRSKGGDQSWKPLLHPDDVEPTKRIWQEAVATGAMRDNEYRFKDYRTGEYRWFLGRALPVKDVSGNVIRWFGTCTDIHTAKLTEQALRANEERLRAIVQATPECVKVIAASGALLQMNQIGLRLIEADSEDAVRGMCVLEVVAPEHRQRWQENHERVCRGESLQWEFEIIGLRGTRRWMETHAVPLTMPGGERAHLAVTRDITDRMRIEQDKEQLLGAERAARAEAERTGRMKDEFLATLSHELRTPLNAILGYATLLQMANMDETEVRESIATIEHSARLQAQLIDDLLDMNRIVSGKIRLEVQRLDLPELVDAAIETVRPGADAKAIRIERIVDPLAGPVRGDPGRMQQVIWNLLSNAIKFTPKHGNVQVSLSRISSHVEIAVSDTGEGIVPEFLPHVFDRFRQADASTTRMHGGLGLGLSIVKQLIELHGGTVRAESPGAGHGATFVVTLPLLALQDTPQALPGDSPRTTGAAALAYDIDLSGVRVLVVDDEPIVCALVRRVLHECKATVQTATSAAAALSLLRQETFDVLVSDIGMPGEDGYHLIRAVRGLDTANREIPAAALTAFARAEDRVRTALAGFRSHLSKPVEASELVAVVANLAGRTGL